MGTILIILVVIGFFMSNAKEKSDLLKEIITNIGGPLLIAGVLAFILHVSDVMPFEKQVYFLKRILFGNPFAD